MFKTRRYFLYVLHFVIQCPKGFDITGGIRLKAASRSLRLTDLVHLQICCEHPWSLMQVWLMLLQIVILGPGL